MALPTNWSKMSDAEKRNYASSAQTYGANNITQASKNVGGTTYNYYVPKPKNDPPYVPPTNDDGGNYDNGGSSSYNAILDAYKSQLSQARDSYLAEIEARFNANKKAYEDQMEQAKQQYQSNRNTSEVNRYKAKRAIRESLANRGQLDSGYGRQEALDMNLSYDNALNNINNQEASTLNQIKNYILQLEADAKKEKANTQANYSNALLSLANL